ncbi:MAG: class I SAM-dependent methyltransferase [bacterium]
MPFQLPLLLCPICQKQEKFDFIRDYQNKDGKFSLYECRNCQVQFWNPFKNPGKEWYEREYDYKARNILISKSYRGCHKKFLKRFENFPPKTKILDIGCGIGEFLAELQERGCEAWGVDFNKNHTEIAKNKFGLKNIYTMDFGDFFKKEDLPQFDIIAFFGLLEHIDNPLELVQKVEKILKPGGVLATSAPSKDNLVTGMSYRDLPPDHLSQWNRKAIASLFQKIGFNIFHIEYLDQFNSFKSVITEKFRFGLVDKTAETLNFNSSKKQSNVVFLKIIHLLGNIKDYIIGGIPAGFLWVVSRLMGRRGGTMFVILKKS